MESSGTRLVIDQESDSVDKSYLDAFSSVEKNVGVLQAGDLERKLSKADQLTRFKHVAEFFRVVRYTWVKSKKLALTVKSEDEINIDISWAEVFYRRFRAAKQPLSETAIKLHRYLWLDFIQRARGPAKPWLPIVQRGVQYLDSHKVDLDNALIGLAPSSMVLELIVPFDTTVAADAPDVPNSRRGGMVVQRKDTVLEGPCMIPSPLDKTQSDSNIGSLRKDSSSSPMSTAQSSASSSPSSTVESSTSAASVESADFQKKSLGASGLLSNIFGSKPKREVLLPIAPSPDPRQLAEDRTRKYLINTLIELSYLRDHGRISKHLVELSNLLQLAHGSPTRKQLRAGSLVLVKLSHDQQRKVQPVMAKKSGHSLHSSDCNADTPIWQRQAGRIYFARVITPPQTSPDLFLNSRASAAETMSSTGSLGASAPAHAVDAADTSTILISLDPFETDVSVKFLVDTDCIRSIPDELVTVCAKAPANMVYYPLLEIYDLVSKILKDKIQGHLVANDVDPELLTKLHAKQKLYFSDYENLRAVISVLQRDSSVVKQFLLSLVKEIQLFLDKKVDEVCFSRMYFPSREQGFNELYKYRRQLAKMAAWQLESMVSLCELHSNRLQDELRLVIDGKRRQSLVVWWTNHIEQSCFTFLESHGFVQDPALGPSGLRCPPNDLVVHRCNLSLIDKLLNLDQDHIYEVSPFVDEVCAKVYAEVDQFLYDATAAVTLELGLPAPSSPHQLLAETLKLTPSDASLPVWAQLVLTEARLEDMQRRLYACEHAIDPCSYQSVLNTLSDLRLLSNMKRFDRAVVLRDLFSAVLSNKESVEQPLSVVVSVLERILSIRSLTEEILTMWDTTGSASVSLSSFRTRPKTMAPGRSSRLMSMESLGARGFRPFSGTDPHILAQASWRGTSSGRRMSTLASTSPHSPSSSIFGLMREMTSALGTGGSSMPELHEALKALQDCSSSSSSSSMDKSVAISSLGGQEATLERKSSFLDSWKELAVASLRGRSLSESNERPHSTTESRTTLLRWSKDSDDVCHAAAQPVIGALEQARSIGELASVLLRDETLFVRRLDVLVRGVLRPLRESDGAGQLPVSFTSGCVHLATLVEIHSELLQQFAALVVRLQPYQVGNQQQYPGAAAAADTKNPAITTSDPRNPATSSFPAGVADPISPFQHVSVGRLRDCHQAYSLWLKESNFVEQLADSGRQVRRHLQARCRVVEERFPGLTFARLIRLPLERIAVYGSYMSMTDHLQLQAQTHD